MRSAPASGTLPAMSHAAHRNLSGLPMLADAEANLAGIVLAHNSHDAAGFAARFAPDGVVRILPTGDMIRGREQIAAFLDANLRAFPDWQLERRGLDDCTDATWVEWTITGTHAGEFMGHHATHRGLELFGCSRFEFTAEGLIAEEGQYFDPVTILRQLGLLLEPPNPQRTPQ